MQNELPIGFFDSGVGGLSVLARFQEILPSENIIYFGDLKNLPYGSKTQAELIGFAKNILDFFKTKNVKAVVIACNTSSALAYEAIKNNYNFKIYPIIQSCAKVISGMDINRVGVFATSGTVASGAYTREIKSHNPEIQVKEIACPNWVNIVENKNLDGVNADMDIENHMSEMMKFNPDKIVLGCTHYPYLLKTLEQYADKKIFIDPAKIFVEYIKNDMKENDLLNNINGCGNQEFYVSANPQDFVENAGLFYNLTELPITI